MGPRFRKRGNTLRRQQQLPRADASMGPRFRKRGNAPNIPRLQRRSPASMGPRFGSAETPARPACPQAPVPRFNGAALSEARKRAPRPEKALPGPSFVGAALWKRGNPLFEWFCNFDLIASMGPRFRKRGNIDVAARSISTGSCFNGAALSEARKPENQTMTYPETLLQWGRAFGSAETRAHAQEPRRRHRASMGPRFRKRGNLGFGSGTALDPIASMGPRFRKRGNSPWCWRWVCMTFWLQWGRAFGSAETMTPEELAALQKALQWGRAFGSAETLCSGE